MEVKTTSDDPLVISVGLVSLSAKEDAERMARDIQLRGDEGTLLNVDDFGESQLTQVAVVGSQSEEEEAATNVIPIVSSSQVVSSADVSLPKAEKERSWQVTFLLTLLDLTTEDFGDEHWSMLKESLCSSVSISLEQVWSFHFYQFYTYIF